MTSIFIDNAPSFSPAYTCLPRATTSLFSITEFGTFSFYLNFVCVKFSIILKMAFSSVFVPNLNFVIKIFLFIFFTVSCCFLLSLFIICRVNYYSNCSQHFQFHIYYLYLSYILSISVPALIKYLFQIVTAFEI